jgi:hypothetical protein
LTLASCTHPCTNPTPLQLLTTGVDSLTACVPYIWLHLYTMRGERFRWPHTMEMGGSGTSTTLRNTHSRQSFEVLVEKRKRVLQSPELRVYQLMIVLKRGST